MSGNNLSPGVRLHSGVIEATQMRQCEDCKFYIENIRVVDGQLAKHPSVCYECTRSSNWAPLDADALAGGMRRDLHQCMDHCTIIRQWGPINELF